MASDGLGSRVSQQGVRQMLFLALIYLIYISIGLPDAVLGASWPLMHAAIGVPMSSAGFISLVTSCGTIFASLFSHRAIHRFGTGKVVALSILFMAIALLGTALSPSLIWLLVFALPLGLGVGAVDSGLNVYVAQHYQARHMNWLHCFWGLGAMTGPLLVSFFSAGGYGWQRSYFTFSLLQFGLTGLVIMALPGWKRHQNSEKIAQHQQPDTQPGRGMMSLFSGKAARLATLTFFIYTAIESNMMLWGASYLVQVKLASPQTAAAWISLLFLGITAGRLLSGFVSIRLRNEVLIRSASILVIIGFVLLLISADSWLTISALTLIGFGFAPIFPSMMHETSSNFKMGEVQAAIGLQMAFAYVGNTVMPPLLGYLYTGISFVWMPLILLFLSMVLYACTSYLFKLRKISN
ncbi:MAG: MFS transporter [Clostridiales bacterium]|nr:MFS transporter [Clostridiales bacterium]